MLDPVLQLQVWGGLFFSLNKVFFSFAERSGKELKRLWRIASWIIYLLGLPPWVIILALERNWIAASVEAGLAPAMVIGLIIAVRGHGHAPRWLDWIARIAVVAGIIGSLADFGGIFTLTQYLELGLAVGALVGTYLLAKQRPAGYYWFMLMNGSCAALMYREGYNIMSIQQLLSFVFILDALLMERRHRSPSS